MTLFKANGKVMEPAFQVFRGIPYAKAERWKAPEVMDKFDGDVGSNEPAPACLVDFQNPRMTIDEYQALIDDKSVSENCLTLDIYKPNNDIFADVESQKAVDNNNNKNNNNNNYNNNNNNNICHVDWTDDSVIILQ